MKTIRELMFFVSLFMNMHSFHHHYYPVYMPTEDGVIIMAHKICRECGQVEPCQMYLYSCCGNDWTYACRICGRESKTNK